MLERPKRSILEHNLAEAKEAINAWMYDQTKGIVQSGPFANMRVLHDEFWSDGSLSCKLLGCYEQELHQIIEQEIDRLELLPSPKVVNIGCAEGYYAVGIARRLPKADVWIVDFEEAMAIANKAADLNEVELVSGAPITDTMKNADLIVIDCEGAEVDYLDKTKFPSLAKSTIVVECHDIDAGKNSKVIAERFMDTHQIYIVIEGARDPNKWDFLRQWHSMARWAAVSEGRPCMMHWFCMRPK